LIITITARFIIFFYFLYADQNLIISPQDFKPKSFEQNHNYPEKFKRPFGLKWVYINR